MLPPDGATDRREGMLTVITIERALQLLSKHRSELRSRFGVRSLALFGSVARGDAGPDSDLDVLVDFEGPPTFDGYMGTRFYLEDLLGLKVDLVTPGGVRPELRLAIEQEAVRVP